MLSLCAGTAVADSDWQTVSLDGDPNFTIDVPADVGKDFVPDKDHRDAGFVLSFDTVADGARTVMKCDLARQRFDNPAVTRKMIARAVGKSACVPGLDSLSSEKNISVETTRPVTLGRAPAYECLMSYEGAPLGVPPQLSYSVQFNVGIAGRHSFFALACVESAASRNETMAVWRSIWAAKVSHIERSLHLPKAER